MTIIILSSLTLHYTYKVRKKSVIAKKHVSEKTKVNEDNIKAY